MSSLRRASSWDVAAACVDECLRLGVAPSLEQLGRLGQLGTLPSLVAALGEEDETALAADHGRERESLGFAPEEVVGELLVLGRVLGGEGDEEARAALDHCLLAYVARITGDLAERARRDALTGLLNHAAFHDRVTVEVERARRYRGRVALVLLDVDGLKQTNDRKGHREGDRLLRALAAALLATARDSDALGRLGGDEFGALLLGADGEAARAFLARFEALLPPGLGVSAGSACVPAECGDTETLFALADRRLYAQKPARAA